MNVNGVRNRNMHGNVRRSLAMVRKGLLSLKTVDFCNADLAKPSMHLLDGSGKLLRPALVLESAAALGKKPEDFVDLAVAIELLHTSSLLHDDIIDRDIVRRGIESVHVKYGKEAAILSGDALIAKAVQKSCRYGTEIVHLISQAALRMCAGEMLDYRYQKTRKVPSIDSYVEIASLKSGALISISASAAAKDSKDKLYKSLSIFGTNVGIGFQIRDDVIDALGADLKNGTADSRKFRPNIVNTLIKHSNLRKNDAISEAIELNNKYIDMANSEIFGKAGFEDLIKHAEKMKLK